MAIQGRFNRRFTVVITHFLDDLVVTVPSLGNGKPTNDVLFRLLALCSTWSKHTESLAGGLIKLIFTSQYVA